MTGFLLVIVLALSAQAAPSGQAKPSGQVVATKPTAPSVAGYNVGANDVLKITVVGEDQLTNSYKVDVDGSITFPLLGRVMVAGRSVRDIEQHIHDLLQKGFVRRPQVLVEVEEYRSRSVYILGEVKQTGKYGLQGDMTLLEMLTLAGSVTSNAGSEVLVLRRRDPASVASAALPGESDEVARVNMADLREGKLVGNFLLQDGDTIVVPPLDQFYVSGFVRTPGGYPLKPGMTVQQAIAVAGGLTERGSSRRIKIRRQTGPNTFEMIDVKSTDTVKANDTIIVPQRFI
jgi:polysaccharide export outer membrane protein